MRCIFLFFVHIIRSSPADRGSVKVALSQKKMRYASDRVQFAIRKTVGKLSQSKNREIRSQKHRFAKVESALFRVSDHPSSRTQNRKYNLKRKAFPRSGGCSPAV